MYRNKRKKISLLIAFNEPSPARIRAAVRKPKMNNTEQVRIETPSLPKGGGAITGMTGEPGIIGPDGASAFSVPLPVSRGRGYFPEPVLSYNSRNGNDAFGLGWTVSMAALSRRVVKGVPRYTNEDEFTDPDNEVIVPVLGSDGKPVSSPKRKLLDTDLISTG